MEGRLPIYEQVADHLLFDPRGRHHWREDPLLDEPSHIDAEWNETAEMDLGAEADAWTGVTRNDLPVTERPRGDQWPTPYRSS